MGITLVISFIPFLGCGAWVLVWPVAIAAIVMGIVVMVRGSVAKGALIILGAILLVPISIFGPVYTTVAIGAVGETGNPDRGESPPDRFGQDEVGRGHKGQHGNSGNDGEPGSRSAAGNQSVIDEPTPHAGRPGPDGYDSFQPNSARLAAAMSSRQQAWKRRREWFRVYLERETK
jgi:hypothetical protein